MILTDLVRTIKPPIFFITVLLFFIVVPCDISNAQGSSYSSQSASPYLPRAEAPVVHGMGVTSLSSYFPDSSYKEAYKRSIEDLRANLMTSVYLESFKTTMLTRNREFAITNTIDTTRVVKLDSTAYNGYVYFFTSLDSLSARAPSVPGLNREQWAADTFNPRQNGHFWMAAGKEEFSTYAPYESWAKSKLDALSRLSRLLQTKVQSSIKSYNSFSQELTYITSKTIFRDIMVLDRTMNGGYCYTLVGVDQNGITYLD